MSLPYIGDVTFLPEGHEKWDAAAIEALLRAGGCIYFEDSAEPPYGRAECVDGQFRFVSAIGHQGVVLESVKENFLEFACWVAFMGREHS